MGGIFDDPTLYPGDQQELRDFLSAITQRFILDGVPLEMECTRHQAVSASVPEFSEVPFIVAWRLDRSPSARTSYERSSAVREFEDELTVRFTVVPC